MSKEFTCKDVKVTIKIPELIPEEFIRQCPSSQCRWYMRNKNKKITEQYYEKLRRQFFEELGWMEYDHVNCRCQWRLIE